MSRVQGESIQEAMRGKRQMAPPGRYEVPVWIEKHAVSAAVASRDYLALLQ